MDRLIALVGLRWRLAWRVLLGRREHAYGLALLLPGLILSAGLASAIAFFGVRALERSHSALALSVLSAAATAVGLFWALSPLLTGLAVAETHDLGRLLHFPLPFKTLLGSSLLANLLEPTVLAKLPVIVAFTAALSPRPATAPFVALGALSSFALMLAAAQTLGLLLHALSRNRRFSDRALFLGLGLGFLLSLLPLLLLGGGWGTPLMRAIIGADLFRASPYAWGVRAAIHASRGEALAFAALLLAALASALGVFGLNAAIARRLYEGELVLGASPRAAPGRRALVLGGVTGALVEKDLRLIWRDPRLRAALFTGMLGPLLLILLWRGASGRLPPSVLLFLAAFSGLGTLGGNAFALERRGLLLLFSFPVERLQILFAKNLAAFAVRLPALLALGVAAAVIGPGSLPVALLLAVGLITMLLMAAADNFMSILFPVPVPEPGRNPLGPSSGGRGLAAAALGTGLTLAALAASSPFWFLAWLPLPLERPAALALSLPLALAGAASVYALLTAGAARLLESREPELLARVLDEE